MTATTPDGTSLPIANTSKNRWRIDPRDGQPKLMEINPRLGIKLWYRTELGINEPMMCLQIARGEKVGVLSLNVLRPFPTQLIRDTLRNVKAVVVGDRADSYGADGGNLSLGY